MDEIMEHYGSGILTGIAGAATLVIVFALYAAGGGVADAVTAFLHGICG